MKDKIIAILKSNIVTVDDCSNEFSIIADEIMELLTAQDEDQPEMICKCGGKMYYDIQLALWRCPECGKWEGR